MNTALIIARYKEDLSWLKTHKDFNLYIYNKGSQLKEKEFKNVIKLKNIGRESQTWLYHIVKNYNNLEEINIFMQGRVDDLDCMAYKNPKLYLKKIDKYGFVASRFGMLSPFHWKYNVGIENNKKYKKEWDNKGISRSKKGFRRFAKDLFPDIPFFVATSYGGCFAVKKELIKNYDIDHYSYLLNILSQNKNPIEGHYLERLWCYMFSQNTHFYRAIRDVIKTKIERSLLSKIS